MAGNIIGTCMHGVPFNAVCEDCQPDMMKALGTRIIPAPVEENTMADNEPLNDERLAEIREYLAYSEVSFDEAMSMLNRLVPPVLAEVERLRSEVAGYRRGLLLSLEPGVPQLVAENIAMRAFLQRFVAYDDNPYVNDPVTPEEARILLANDK